MGKYINVDLNNNKLSIGEASEFVGVSIDTLRRWEKKDAVKVYRSPGGHRYFLKDDLKGLFKQKYVRAGKDADVNAIPSSESQKLGLVAETHTPPPVQSVYTQPQRHQPEYKSAVATFNQTPPPPSIKDNIEPTGLKEYEFVLPSNNIPVKKGYQLFSKFAVIGLISFAIVDLILLIIYFLTNKS